MSGTGGGPGEDDGRPAPQRGRRRVWRWAVGVWAVAVLVGGGLTLWLQDSTEPPPPTGWEPAPAPLVSADVRDLPCPSASDGQRAVVCAYATLDPDR